MLSIIVYLSLFTTIALSDITCPTPDASCEINCGNYTINNCANSVVNGSLASNLSIICPTLTSCMNMTAICPTTNDINTCEITCSDSNSCDATRIISESETTILNCITTDFDKTNICTNNVTIILSGNDINMATINCVSNISQTNDTVIVCNDLIIKTLNTTIPKSESLLSFYCQGNGINCDQINIDSTKMNRLSVYTNGFNATITNSTFINTDNIYIEIKDNANIALSSFNGTMSTTNSVVDIIIKDSGVLNMNNFMFDGVNKFSINTANNVVGAGLLNHNNIHISNTESGPQTVILSGINGDNTNIINAAKCNSFELICTNNLIDCGNIGMINVMHATDTVNISIGKNVNFTNIINAYEATGLGLYILDGGIMNGLVLNATDIGYLNMNIYGNTYGTNMIYASNAQTLYLSCYNNKSCSNNLQLYASEGKGKTTIECIGNSCDMMTLNISTTMNDITFKKSNCSCYDERNTLCINEWNINCANKQSKIKNANCSGDSICCGNVIQNLQEPEPDNYTCPLSTKTKYICQKDQKCVVNCSNPMQYDKKTPFKCSLNGIIDGSMAESLNIDCNKDTATCKGLKVLCPPNLKPPHNFCQLNCNDTNSCSDLEITTNDNQNVFISCLMDKSCHNITITGQSTQHNKITVNCTKGLCEDITIYGYVADVKFICVNGSVCNNININNDLGNTILNINGTVVTNFINSSISGHSVIINGTKYMFKNNTIKVNIDGVLSVNGDNMSIFDNNTIIHNNDPHNCNHILSINTVKLNNPNRAIQFEKRNKTLQFNKADYINITTTKNNQRFIDNDVVIINPFANIYINNYGILYNNTFAVPQADFFSLLCHGNCFYSVNGTNFMNKLLVDNVTDLYVTVGNGDYISDKSMQIEGGIDNFYITTNKNGTIKDFTVDGMDINHIVITNNNGTIRNISVNAKDAEYFTLGCYGGCNNANMNVNPTINDANTYYLDNVKHIDLDATNDVINKDNTQLLNINNAEIIYLTANMNSALSDFQFNNSQNTISTVIVTSNAGGILNNIYINATNASFFKLDCNSYGCQNTKQVNTFIINNVTSVNFYATNDTINSTNTKLIYDLLKTNVSMFNFVANEDAQINDILIATQNTDIIKLSCYENGRFDNINISSSNINYININNNRGIMNRLIINNPYVINKVNISVIGILTNSSINVQNTNNFNMTCSNVIDNGKEIIAGECKNVTIFTPVLTTANSSLLCENEGCQNMIFYTQNNIDDIENITLSECPCDSATKSSCILSGNKWEIYCKPDSNGNYNGKASVLNDKNKCEGKCCGNVINDLKIKECNYSGGSSKKNKVGAIVGGVCGGILFIVMIASGVYYYKKKKMAEQEALLSVNA